MSAGFPPLARAQLRAAVSVAAAAPAGSDLAAVLYRQWYARPVTPLALPDESWPPLLGVLRAAHAGSERWLPDWRTHRVVDGGIVLGSSAGRIRALPPSQHVSLSAPGTLPSPGEPLLVLDRRDAASEDGYWRTWGGGWPAADRLPAGPLVRIYWNVGLAAVPGLVRRLTAALVSWTDPWLLKCPLEPSGYRRRDAVVLYLPVAALGGCARSLRWACSDLRPVLRPGAPPLTLPVGRGVGLAEEPGTGESYGEHRCRLIASALSTVDGWGSPGSLAAVARAFEAAGVVPSRPHRHTGARWLAWEH